MIRTDGGHVWSPGISAIAASSIMTPLGQVLVASSEGAVLAVSGPGPGSIDHREWARRRWPGENVVDRTPGHREIVAQMREFFAGRRRAFDVPLVLEGSDLHVRAWLAATEIPFGKSLTYGELAWDIGAPGAARAVGRAMSLCVVPVFVPCHRVVGSGGRRCGSLESWVGRQALLEFERARLEPALPVRLKATLSHR